MSNFRVYKSSAGSGKTFTLVKSYLLIALADEVNPPTKYQSILAITFTNKAAGEMKERILSTLRSISNIGINDRMGEQLCQELQLTSDKIKIRSVNLLNAILHNYSEFSVGTIDRFVHRVIRTFSLDLRLPMNFSIETNTDEILLKCVDALLAKVGDDQVITNILLQFTKSRVDEDKNWRVEKELLSFAGKLIKIENAELRAKLEQVDVESLLEARDQMKIFIKKYEIEIKKMASDTSLWMIQQGLDPSDFYQGARGIAVYFKKIESGNVTENLYKSFVKESVDEGRWRSNSKKCKLTDEHIVYLTSRFQEIEDYKNKNLEKYLVFNALLGNIYALMVLKELQAILAKIKQDQNLIFISEFNALISEIIRTEPVPFIYERIGERYKHYLLDEFQDTSVLQWRNLLPLIDNSLASGNYNLIVGDGKQSIYRWRGGDVDQFADLPKINGKKNKIVQEREDSLVRNYHEEILNINYRSKEEIVTFNNSFYSYLSNEIIPQAYKKVYKDCIQETRKDSKGGYISFDIIENSEEDNQVELVCKATADYVRLNHDVYGYSYSDITVLVRKKRHGKLIADYLLKEKIPIVSSETLLLSANAGVNFLIALMNLVQDERNQLEEARVIRYLSENNPKLNAPFEKIWSEFTASKVDIWEFLKSRGLSGQDREFYAAMPLYELCCSLVRDFKPIKNDHLFVQFFLDEIIKYSRNNPENLSCFIDWWNSNSAKCSAILPSGADAVNIMTIHTSKGLQFPVVIIPFSDWENFQTDSVWIEVDEPDMPQIPVSMINSPSKLKETKYANAHTDEKEKQILDNVNLLYVATTRAENHLHIVSINKNRSNYVDKWLRDFFNSNESYEKNENTFQIGVMEEKTGNNEFPAGMFSYNFRISDNIELLELKTSIDQDEDGNQKISGKEYGILFHKSMNRIYCKADANGIKEWLISQSLCDSVLANQIQSKIISLMNRDDFACFFPDGNRSKNEPEMRVDAEEYRPDRLIFMDNSINLLEYKTGEKNEKHKDQIGKYASGVAKLFGCPVNCYLVYVEDEIIFNVSPN
jgi:ATP-dependent exoDNAse (exonuclease V) beta subunit